MEYHGTTSPIYSSNYSWMMFHDLPIDTNFYIIYKVFVHGFPSHLCLKPPLVSPWRREVGDLSHLLHRWQRDARQVALQDSFNRCTRMGRF